MPRWYVRASSRARREEPGMSDLEELQAGLPHPGVAACEGRLEMVVRRPAEDERRSWPRRGSSRAGAWWATVDLEPASPEAEVTLMNARCVAVLAGEVDRWPLAGDQLYVDVDLGEEPAGREPAPHRRGGARGEREAARVLEVLPVRPERCGS